jgi:hypothetical protein
MTSGATAPALPRDPGFIRGIMLLLPITLAVMGISVLTPVVHLMLEQFKAVPNHDYLVIGGVPTIPAIWVLLFSPAAGWMASQTAVASLSAVRIVALGKAAVAIALIAGLPGSLSSSGRGRIRSSKESLEQRL